MGFPLERIAEIFEDASFIPLPIAINHARLAGGLPPHHKDPFDRLLIAQAQSESLTLVTTDAAIAAYEVSLFPPRTGQER